MMSIIADLIGSRYVIYVIYALAIAGIAELGWLVVSEHDAGIAAGIANREAQAHQAEIIARQSVALAALDKASGLALARQGAATLIRERIIREPIQTACVASPAVRDALDGLRQGTSATHGADRAGQPVDLSGTARRPAKPVR
jgi:hypothetical protein